MLHYRQASPICGMFKISVDSLQKEDKQSKEQLGQTRSTAAFRGQTTTKIKPCFFLFKVLRDVFVITGTSETPCQGCSTF